MRFLADENFPGGAVAALQSNGYDVAWIRTLSPEISDSEVLKHFNVSISIVNLARIKGFTNSELLWNKTDSVKEESL